MEDGSCTEEGEDDLSKYLQDVLGDDFDSSFMEEFKSSEIFEDYVKEFSQSNHSSLKSESNISSIAGLAGRKIFPVKSSKVLLCDLNLMTQLFPNGIQSRVTLSLLICEQIKDIERQLKNAKIKKHEEIISLIPENLTAPFTDTQTTQTNSKTNPVPVYENEIFDSKALDNSVVNCVGENAHENSPLGSLDVSPQSKAKPALSISLASIKSFISPKVPIKTEIEPPQEAKIELFDEEIVNDVPSTTDSTQTQEHSSINQDETLENLISDKSIVCNEDKSLESMQPVDQSDIIHQSDVDAINADIPDGAVEVKTENQDKNNENAARLDNSASLADDNEVNEVETFECGLDLPNSPEILEASSADETPVPAIPKSPSPERVVPKRKKIIESSSDDGERKDDGDHSDPKKSSDEDGKSNARVCSFERKKDEGDSRTKKFDRFEHERRRKLGETKKEKKGKQRNIIDTLDEFLKEKPLTGSFRIPKRTCGSSRRHEPTSLATPLASVFVPKENLQFEKYRKGKKDRDNDWYSNKKRDSNDFGPNVPFDREVYLRSEEDEKKYGGGGKPTLVANTQPTPIEEASWDDEPDGGSVGVGGGGNSDNGDTKNVVKSDNGDTKNVVKSDNGDTKKVVNSDNGDTKIFVNSEVAPTEENWDDEVVPLSSNSSNDKIIAASVAVVEKSANEEPEEVDFYNPEIPIPLPQVNPFSIGLVTLMKQSEVLDLPDVDEVKDIAESTVKKLSWWFARIDPDSAYVDVNMPSSESDDDSSSEQSYLAILEFSSDEEGSHTVGERQVGGPVDEYCGRALLQAKYRQGDKFVPIFQIRSGASYEKEKFQAECSLCNVLVIGKVQLGEHVTSGGHIGKMATAGMEEQDTTEKKSDEGKESRSEKSERKEKKDTSEERDSSKKKKSSPSRGKGKDKDSEDLSDKKSEKRKRSTDDSAVEKSRDKDRRRSRSRGRRSRSRSPRHKRTRSRSPGRKSKKARSRTPVQRIPRSPTRLEEQRRRERRSTSAERVEKFLARTNKDVHKRRRRRSKSPENAVQVVLKRDNKEFNEKLALTAEGKWTSAMEQRWKLMEAEEAIFMEQFGEKRKGLTEIPENHPTYGEEWTLFWERRFQELEQQGIDPDAHDFVPEWKEFWSKRLKTLLEVEYDNGIKDIKRRHGMDFETLQKLHLQSVSGDSKPTKPVKVEPIKVEPVKVEPVDEKSPLPVPPPVMCPNPQATQPTIFLPRPASVVSSSRSVSEDLTARSMSISDDGKSGRQDACPEKQSTPTVTTDDVISQWEKLKSGGGPTRPSSSSTHWNSSIPVAKSVGGVSDVDSGSIASYDFDGFDVVQVLRLMSGLEDQLSFFAPKVKEYFKQAEELELKKRNKSYVLLDDEDLVVMMFLVRDRFMVMIRANILPRDVLKSLNLTVYALNAMLDSPQCQKYRSKAISAAATTAEEKPKVAAKKNDPSGANFGSETPTGSPESAGNNNIFSLEDLMSVLMKTSSTEKNQIAELLTTFLLSMGREDMSDKELRDFVLQAMSSSTGLSHRSSANQSQGAPAPSRFVKETQERLISETSSKGKTVTSNNNSWGVEDGAMSKTYSVATSRPVGRPYPSDSHAASSSDYTHARMIDDRGRMMVRESNSGISSNESGKESPFSPFSNRNYGNPAAEPSISTQSRFPRPLPHELISPNDHFSRPTSFIRTLPEYRYTEPSVANLVCNKQYNDNETDLSNQTSTKVSGYSSISDNTKPKTSNLPPGIMNLIMIERKKTSALDTSKDNSKLTERLASSNNRHRSTERHKRRKKTRRKRSYGVSDTSTCSDSESRTSRHRQWPEKREKRKTRKGRRKLKNKSADLCDVEIIEYKRSDSSHREKYGISEKLMDQLPSTSNRPTTEDVKKNFPTQPRNQEDKMPKELNRAKSIKSKNTSLQSSQQSLSRALRLVRQDGDPSISDKQENLSCVSSNSSVRSLRQANSDKNRRYVLSEHNSNSDWDAVSEASSRIGGRKDNTQTEIASKRPTPSVLQSWKPETLMKTDKIGGKSNPVEVTSISKTFWTTKDEDNKSMSSISTTGSIDSEKPKKLSSIKTSYRDRGVNDEKEPGEISSSESML